MTDAAGVVSAPAEAENIAVCIRVRPMNERELRAQDLPALSCVPALNVVALTDPATGAPLAGKGNTFQYDQIFEAGSDARAIYARVARRIVRSTLSGINGTIFAYGQTSSGKTFTMQGDGGMPFEPEAESCRPGILQLAVEDVFDYIERCADRDFLLRVSFVEIYNEVVHDLLGPSDNLKLREDPRKGVYVECHEQIITNYEDIVTLLRAGNRNRTVGLTNMNDKSSRSHSVFRLVVESKSKHKSKSDKSRRLSEDDVNGAVLVASLNLVDLAGSESLRHTGNEGIRQREAGNINKSLLTLARVINSLASAGGRGQNAPFRDSKLTRLLQNSLGGNTRTLIICCVTPSDRYIEETKSTLQFAARAKDIKTSATVNEVLDDQTQLRRLKREVHDLKKLVNSEALNALKAENEALLSEKNHNKTEMARLKGLILSSTSVAKAAEDKRCVQRGKRSRETWGPGDFPASIKAQAPLSPHRYPRKRRSSAKENLDPQTLFRVSEDVDEDGHSVDDTAAGKSKASQDVKESSKEVLELLSAVLRNYRDGNGADPIAGIEAIANEKSAALGDVERVRAFDVLADIRALMVENMQSRAILDEKLVLEQELKELRAKLDEGSLDQNLANCDCLENAAKASAGVDEIMAELGSTQEALAKEKRRYQDLETQTINSQQMAAEELGSLRHQLETLKLEVNESRQRFDSEKRELQAALESLQTGLPHSDDDKEHLSMRSRREELEGLLEEMKASQTVLQLAVAERHDEIASLKSMLNDANQTELESRVKSLEEERTLLQQKISELEQQVAEATEKTETEKQSKNAVVEKLAGELQEIMQELTQLQSDHERTALEKQELQAESERISDELDASQRQGYELSETLMQKEHVVKVLQAQLDAKIMTISQMQTKHKDEVEALHQTIQELSNEREQLQADIEELHAAESSSANPEPTQSTGENAHTEANSGEKNAAETEAQKLRSEVNQLTEKLSAVESGLAVKEEHLQASEESSDQSELKAAFDKLQADFDNMQQEHKADPMLLEEKNSLQQRYDALNEDFKRLADDLEKVSRERDDCLEELRALEAQLMEVSEEKMKLAISADEQEIKLREAQRVALSFSEATAALQMQLEDAQSAMVALEASKAELERNVESVQTALTDLQADHAAIVNQIQNHDSVFNSDSESGDMKVEQLQQRLETEAKQREKLELDVQSYEETLSVLRKEANDSSETIADMLEKLKKLESDLESAARTQETKDKELASLTDALARSKEEQQEMRLQSKQRLVAAEGKEMALEEKISALEQQLMMNSNGVSTPSDSMQSATQMELIESREKHAELQSKITTLENELAKAREELRRQDEGWNKKQVMAEREFARLMTEQKRLRNELATLQSSAGASIQEMEAQAEELQKAKQSCAGLSEEKEAVQQELEAANAAWEEKHQELMLQMDSMREQLLEAQNELEEYQKHADSEIHRLRSVIQETNAEIEELKRSAKAREEELESQIGGQVDWQFQVKSQQEALQAKCDELEDERRLLKDEYAALESQRADVEQQLRSEILELSQKCASAQTQQATYQGKLKEMETQLEMTENDVGRYRGEFESLAESLKSSQVEAGEYHSQLVQAQLAKEGMEKLVEKQKARIDKLEKVKMTTETLDLFRKLKQDRHDLQSKVHELQKKLALAEEALTQSQENHQESEQRLAEHKDEELKLLKEHVEELRNALREETQRAADVKTEMRAALSDEREKAEHEIQEMQALVKEKMELVEKLETQVASVHDAMAKLREHKSENVSYLEKENLDLHVENRELKKQLESALSPPEKDELMGDTGTYDASAAAAAKALAEDNSSDHHESGTHEVSDGDATNEDSSQPQEAGTTRAGGFLLSTTELDAIAAHSQEDPGRPDCSQQ
ncbi:hypothetical protein PF008_g4229 [Phytophthora fragariae]|uniref:Kinesin motor domain-containing protein n=1 Tax=Phytophthora fragariae TaxID=53985 RepID=A0A6G0SCZ0_9STRA|nr:hypothetical protein PF008_g4229 [Phytophthora fragariae]